MLRLLISSNPNLGVWHAIALLAAAVTLPSSVVAQDYPNKPIRLIVSEAGGGGDLAARLIARGMTERLGQQVVVDNRGGGGNIAGPLLAKSAPNGYTLTLYGSTFWITPLLHSEEKLYDPLKDFAYITIPTTSPNIVVVHPSLPIKSTQELIAYAKAKPGELNYGSGAAGASTHLAGEIFKSMAHVDIVRIPYKGSGPAMIALIGGSVQLMFSTTGAAAPHIKAGRLRALAVTSAQPSPLVPGLPTVAASGVPGYESVSKDGVFAPAKTPAAIITKLNQTIVQVVKSEDVRTTLLNAGVESVGSTPEQLAAAVRKDIATIGKLIKETGLHAD